LKKHERERLAGLNESILLKQQINYQNNKFQIGAHQQKLRED